MNAFLTYNEDFISFGFQHNLVLLILLILSMGLPWAANRYWSQHQQVWFARIWSILLSSTVIIWTIIRLALGDFDYQTDLPLDICNSAALVLPFLMWRVDFRVFEVLVFWILLGTMVALFTPHLFNAYPNFTFFKYWIVHGGLVVYFLFISAVFKLKPSFKSIGRSFGVLQLYMITIFIFNSILGANYVYLMGKPPTASPMDFLGPWPWYIVVIEIIALVLFYLIWKVFQLISKANS